MAEIIFSWEGPAFEYHQKTAAWYWGTIGVSICALGFAVWQRNFLFGFFVIVAEILLMVWADRRPEHMSVALTSKEVLINGTAVCHYQDVEHFSIRTIDGSALSEIHFSFHRTLKTPLVLSVPSEHVAQVRKALAPFLKEVETHDSLIDSLERFVRF